MSKPPQELPDGFYRASLGFDTPGPSDPCAITWGGVWNADYSPNDGAEAIGTIVADNLDDILSNTVTITDCNLVIAAGGDLYAGLANINNVGNVSQGQAAPQIAILIRKTTAFAGRSFRGRWYIPGVRGDGTLADGTVEGTTLTTAQARADDIYEQLGAIGMGMVVLHSPQKIPGSDPPEYEALAPAPTAVTGLVVESLTATQRRRLR